MENTLKPWRSFTIFVSSTFIDMEAERDYLNNIVAKELEREYEKKRVSLSFVDLRWGVQTDKEAEKETRELSVLNVCMEEIKRSRPFFIALLGHRYGWVPSKERFTQVLESMDEKEKQLLKDGEGASVTALEILFGALGNEELLNRSLFYFRDESVYRQMTPDEQQRYCDVKNAEKLKQLKERIRYECSRKGLDNVHTYAPEWRDGRFTRLEAWGQMVKEHLRREIESELTETAATVPQNWLEMEELQQDIFLHNKTQLFVGREKELDTLEQFARTGQGIIVVPGFPTMGKSAFLCQLYLRLQNDPHLIVMLHCTGASQYACYTYRMFCRLCNVLGQPYNEPSHEGNEARNYFLRLVQQVTASGHKVVLLIDSTDAFRPSDDASNYSWLPDEACCILTCKRTEEQGYEKEITLYKENAQVTYLPFLTPDEAGQLARELCRSYYKNIPESVLRLIVTKQADHQPLPKDYPEPYYACFDPLWVRLMVWYLVSLNEEDYANVRRITEVTDEEAKLERYLCRCVEQAQIDPSNLIIKSIIPRILQEVDQAFLFDPLFVIASAYQGINETDLSAVFQNIWDGLSFSKTHHFLKEVLTQDYETGEWYFSHTRITDFFTSLLSEEEYKQIIIRLGLYYIDQGINRQGAARKAIYSFSQGECTVWAAYLCTILSSEYDVKEVVEEMVESIKMDEERYLPFYIEVFNLQRNETNEQELSENGWQLLEEGRLSRYLIAIKYLLPPLSWWRKEIALAFATGIEEGVRHYADTHPEEPKARALSGMLYHQIANLYEAMGKTEERRRYIALMEESHPDNSLTEEELGRIALDEGRYADAETRYMNHYLQKREALKASPDDPINAYNAFMGCMYLIDVYRRWENYDRLKAMVEEAVTYLPLLPQNPDMEKNVGQFCYIAGQMYDNMGEGEKALKWLNQSVEILERLHAANLQDDKSTIELGVAYEMMGFYHEHRHKEEEALACYRKQAALFDGVLLIDPGNMVCRHFRLIAGCHIWDILYDKEHDNETWYELNRDLVRLGRDTDPDMLTDFDMRHIGTAYYFLHDLWEEQSPEERKLSPKEMFGLLEEGWSALEEAYRKSGDSYYIELGLSCLYSRLQIAFEEGLEADEPLQTLTEAYRTYPLPDDATMGRLINEQKRRVASLLRQIEASPFHMAFQSENYSEAILRYMEMETHSTDEQMLYALCLLRTDFRKKAAETLRRIREQATDDRKTWLLATLNLCVCMLLEGELPMFRQLFEELSDEKKNQEKAAFLWKAQAEKPASAEARRKWYQRWLGTHPSAEELRVELPRPYGWQTL